MMHANRVVVHGFVIYYTFKSSDYIYNVIGFVITRVPN